MQLIGIYLETHDSTVTKNLKENWYPFGRFDECNGENFSKVFNQINENQDFNKVFFEISNINNEKSPLVNLNCIVGKNGSGKSSVLSLLYRIINNLACKLKELLPDLNKDYSPVWAWGFNAKLYYEIENKIGCIEVFDNEKFQYNEERTENLPVKLIIFDDNGTKEEIISETSIYSNSELLEKLGKYIFYTVGTNYSLYTNSVVRFDYDESQENWMNTIYHKNDGYFTPIVLVPYRNYNGKNSIIDTEKELKLANERVNTLAILLKASDNSQFIEDFLPEKVIYELKDEKTYENEIKQKIRSLSSACKKEENFKELKLFINNVWKNQLENFIDKNNKLQGICFNNILYYLVYKTIKICIYYDRYKNIFDNGDIFSNYENNKKSCVEKLEKIILKILNDKEPTDFINLKIKQCIDFLRNGSFYSDKITNGKGEISVDEIIKKIPKENLTYDSVFLKLLPPIFKKEYKYKNIKYNEEVTISQMSSGEQQMLYSLSYTVYHMKNAVSNQNQLKNKNSLISIPYKNINLIFDEAELYYHPEYQRQFIDKLLGILKRSHFEKDVDSINITLVTHSPFMLSDVPEANILALNEGKNDKSFECKTLGANIYDLLANQFFMESAIGSRVEGFINEIISDYNLYKNEESKEKIIKKYKDNNFYKKFVEEIGDEYLRNVIYDMILQINEISYNQRIIETYKSKINDLEKNEKN